MTNLARPWDDERMLAALLRGPQTLTFHGLTFTFYAQVNGLPGHYVATRQESIRVLVFNLGTQRAERIVPGATPLALSPWTVSASNLVSRATACRGLTEEDAREAVYMHLTAGLTTPYDLCVGLGKLVGDQLPDLRIRLLHYGATDMIGSPRLHQACAEAIMLLLAT